MPGDSLSIYISICISFLIMTSEGPVKGAYRQIQQTISPECILMGLDLCLKASWVFLWADRPLAMAEV
jgi:hypothetical protein